MQFNKYNLYSMVSDLEKKHQTDMSKINDMINLLETSSNKEDIKAWFLKEYGIKDDILNLGISSNTRITIQTYNEKLNVVVLQDKKRLSYIIK